MKNLKNSKDTSPRFNLVSFNILAPCYNRLLSKNSSKGWVLESSTPKVYEKRNVEILQLFQLNKEKKTRVIEFDVLNIQEFWFKKSYMKIYENFCKKENFQLIRKKRTNWKDDGLAIIVNLDTCKIICWSGVEFNGVGDRIALFALIEMKKKGKGKLKSGRFLVVNTHLTFPHHHYDEKILRMQQIKKILRRLDDFKEENKINEDVTTVICGDLNVGKKGAKVDLVLAHLKKNKYLSAFFVKNKNHKFISHVNHHKQKVGSDFVHYNNKKLKVVDCFFHPKGEDFDECDIIKRKTSDHLPLVTIFEY